MAKQASPLNRVESIIANLNRRGSVRLTVGEKDTIAVLDRIERDANYSVLMVGSFVFVAVVREGV